MERCELLIALEEHCRHVVACSFSHPVSLPEFCR